MDDSLINYFDKNLTAQEKEKILHSLKENKESEGEFNELMKTWILTSASKDKSAALDLDKEYDIFYNKIENSETISSKLHDEPKVSLRILYQVAAVGLLLIMLGSIIFWQMKPKEKNAYNEITTLTGQKAQITLSDGTKIWLNASSRLKYPTNMDGKEVHVYLTGEAYFDVKHNVSRLFQVHAAELNIKVLGTAFNVKSYPEEKIVETTLVRGQIRLESTNSEKDNYVLLRPNQKASFLRSNAKLVVSESTNKNIRDRSDDITQIKAIAALSNANVVVSAQINPVFDVSWKDGKLEFVDESFASLTSKLERWFGVKIEIKNKKLEDVKYTGTFEKETIEQALKALSLTLPFKYTIDKDSITIY